MEKKYELTDETKIIKTEECNIVLHRIRSLSNFNDVKKGDLGGWVEKEENLAHYGNCWVYGDACIYGGAMIVDNAIVQNDATVCGRAIIKEDSSIKDSARIAGYVHIGGKAVIRGNATVYGECIIGGLSNISDSAKVHGNAFVTGTSTIEDNAEVYGCAKINSAMILENTKVYGDAVVDVGVRVTDNVFLCGGAEVAGRATIAGDAYVTSTEEVITVGVFGVYLTFFKDKNGSLLFSDEAYVRNINDLIERPERLPGGCVLQEIGRAHV